jgi:hypothetical protein
VGREGALSEIALSQCCFISSPTSETGPSILPMINSGDQEWEYGTEYLIQTPHFRKMKCEAVVICD